MRNPTDCSKLGCDVSELGPWSPCKRGTFERDGKVFEDDKNFCARFCDLERTVFAPKRIKCVCDYAAASCSFQTRIFYPRPAAYVSMHALKENGDKYIKTDICEVEPTEPPPTTQGKLPF